MNSHPTEMYRAAADLLLLASLAIATNRYRKPGMDLVHDAIKIIEGLTMGRCPCGRWGPEACEDCRGEEATPDA